ncbi:hypothetical protein ONZ51_g12691 [Trametes cubensis]|uniref:C2H2-type domain-containing protein n=1 Tax=Trametes cubensis TaxID=1111947 RepID=A0AAD7X579_9APHY|nr:hypothetical protein ONZ51_g12691 [Trametes cubensis]
MFDGGSAVFDSPGSEGFPCPVPGCGRTLRNRTGFSQHIQRIHPGFHGISDVFVDGGHVDSDTSSSFEADSSSVPSPADVNSGSHNSIASRDHASNVSSVRFVNPPHINAALTDDSASDASDTESSTSHSSSGSRSDTSFSSRSGALLVVSDDESDMEEGGENLDDMAPAVGEGRSNRHQARFHPQQDYQGREFIYDANDPIEDDLTESQHGSIDGHRLQEFLGPLSVPTDIDRSSVLPTSSSSRDGSFSSHRLAPESSPLNSERPEEVLEEPSSSSRASSDPEATNRTTRELHPYINARICDDHGNHIEHHSSLRVEPASDMDWTPYTDRLQFETAELLYAQEQMSAANIDRLLELWEASLIPHGEASPFKNHVDLYRTIDSTELGDVRWQCFTIRYQKDVPLQDPPPWMLDEHEVWYRDVRTIVKQMLSNPDFKSQIAYAPYREFSPDGTRLLRDFMSGDWAWRQADILSEHEGCHGSAFVPIILGSDKTTVSVATGQNDYYPLYVSIGNVENSVRRAHRNAVALAAFLAIPHTTRQFNDDANFRKFRRQLFHTSIARILDSLQAYMETPDIVLCGDGRYRKVLYSIGPYIADYPEQALLASIVQGWCPTCTATNKDLDGPGAGRRSRAHTELLVKEFELGELWDDYGLVGDVVVYLPALHGRVHRDVVQTVRAFLEFCYIVRRDVHSPSTLKHLQNALDRFHKYPVHYARRIWDFGAPNGLCSSITESKHIKAVKEPWRRSNRHEALGQMLLTNQRMDKLSASRVHFENRQMLARSHIESVKSQHDPDGVHMKRKRGRPKKRPASSNLNGETDPDDSNDSDDSGIVEGPRVLARTTLSAGKQRKLAGDMALTLTTPNLIEMMRRFLFHQLHPGSLQSGSTLSLDDCPPLDEDAALYLHFSAEAVFYAPSDISGTTGMRKEFIRATPSWRKKHPRYDCVFINRNSALPGLLGMDVGRVKAFISFKYGRMRYECALVHWYKRVGSSPDEDTGMWIVKPAMIRGRCYAFERDS